MPADYIADTACRARIAATDLVAPIDWLPGGDILFLCPGEEREAMRAAAREASTLCQANTEPGLGCGETQRSSASCAKRRHRQADYS